MELSEADKLVLYFMFYWIDNRKSSECLETENFVFHLSLKWIFSSPLYYFLHPDNFLTFTSLHQRILKFY